MNDKLLKPYKGYAIEKSWDENYDGTIKKDTVVYTAYTSNYDLYDAAKSLAELKKKIDAYMN